MDSWTTCYKQCGPISDHAHKQPSLGQNRLYHNSVPLVPYTV